MGIHSICTSKRTTLSLSKSLADIGKEDLKKLLNVASVVTALLSVGNQSPTTIIISKLTVCEGAQGSKAQSSQYPIVGPETIMQAKSHVRSPRPLSSYLTDQLKYCREPAKVQFKANCDGVATLHWLTGYATTIETGPSLPVIGGPLPSWTRSTSPKVSVLLISSFLSL